MRTPKFKGIKADRPAVGIVQIDCQQRDLLKKGDVVVLQKGKASIAIRGLYEDFIGNFRARAAAYNANPYTGRKYKKVKCERDTVVIVRCMCNPFTVSVHKF